MYSTGGFVFLLFHVLTTLLLTPRLFARSESLSFFVSSVANNRSEILKSDFLSIKISNSYKHY